MAEHVATNTSQASDRHWVEDLFPPHFTVKLSDLTEKPKAADKGTLEAWRLSQRTKMRDIYEEVRAKMEAEAKIPKDKNIQVGAPMSKTQHNVQLKGQARRTVGSSKSGVRRNSSGNKENGADPDGMWTSDEMAVLRKEFQDNKEERRIIGLELKALQKDFRELDTKFREQTALLNAKLAELKRAQQECKRLRVQQQFTAKEVKLLESKLAMAEDDYREVVEQRLSLRREIAEARTDRARARQDAKELRIKLAEAETGYRLEMLEREETIRLEYESQVAGLYRELAEARTELDREQSEHRRAKKALDHLRVHFAQVASSQGHVPQSDSDALMNMQTF
ncbi:uncharacterized protein [Diadema antillarum]|uniref:uncharacterized protein n=1 Tax=Diadema antillarum TaxID=105358 RepID=UPI003A86DF9F